MYVCHNISAQDKNVPRSEDPWNAKKNVLDCKKQ